MSLPAEATAPSANPSFAPSTSGIGRHARSASDAFVRTLKTRPEFFALLAFAALLYLWGISVSGWANDYYAAAARSMGSDWHNFLYNSFDPSGVQTVDKPPLALWVQALSVRVFGFHSLSLLVPQALMGVGTVALSYNIVFKRFGRMAAAFAGFGLAVTPILVAISRHNNPDALLTLLSVGAVWALLRAIDDGRMRWVVVAGALVGLAFETKMAAGLLILPAMVAAYLWIAPGGYPAAIKKALAGGAALLVTGLAWPVLVWLTPATHRPWISGTNDNSIWSLITGYNGVGRVEGQAGGPAGAAGGGAGVGGPGNGGGGMGGSVFGNDPGIFRLFGTGLGGQAAWLLIFSIVVGVALVVATRLRRDDKRTAFVIAVGGSLLTIAAAFSFAKGIFHPYYVVQFAPFAAMLFGAGFAVLRKSDTIYRVLAGAAMLLSAYATLKITSNENASFGPLPLLIVVVAITATGALFIPNITARERGWAVGAFMALLLVAPTVWALQTPGHALSSTFPSGGPQSTQMGPGGAGGRGAFGGRRGFPGGPGAQGGTAQVGPGFGPPGASTGTVPGAGSSTGATGGPMGGGMFGGGQTTTQAVRYAASHGGGTVGVAGQTAASSSIIASDAKVAGLGGFSGRESSVSVSWLADAVAEGRIRWVMTEGGQMVDQSGRAGSSAALAAAASACTEVTSSSAPTGLYDCQGKASALRAVKSS